MVKFNFRNHLIIPIYYRGKRAHCQGRVKKIFLIFLLLLCLPLIVQDGLCSEKEVELEPIVIMQDEAAPSVPTKDIRTIHIRREPIDSIDRLLDYQGRVDILRRGTLGTQSDLTIRGSTPEETKVSVNGIPINNPQTAHHNLDLGLPSGIIEKMEVCSAASPLSWSQGAMGGGVNIVTKKPKDETEVLFLYGTNEIQKASLNISRTKGASGLGLAIEEVSSNGWRYDTDFRGLAVASNGLLSITKNLSSNLLASYGEKEFGAANFYGLYDSKEWTNTMFLNWDIGFKKEEFSIRPRVYFKQHHDKYMLDIARPNYYVNHHKTDIKGILLETETDLKKAGSLEVSGEIEREDIKSGRLGKHRRDRNSVIFSWDNYKLSILGYDTFLCIDDYSDYETEILHGAGLFFMLNKNIKLRSSVSKATRPPTYTELFYDSPANKGNVNLSTEKATNYEAGVDINTGERQELTLSCTAFRRDSSDLIDWIKETPSQAYYQTRNITEVKTEGFELNLNIRPLQWLNLKSCYAYIDSDIRKDYNYISKYALNQPDHKITGRADFILPFGTQGITLIYKDRKHYSRYLIMGCNMVYEFAKTKRLFLNIDNLFNSSYEDIKDNTLPRREIQAGITFSF